MENNKKTYKITYKEVVYYDYYIEAENEEEAEKEFDRQVKELEIDFSDGEIEEAYIESITQENIETDNVNR